MLDSHCAYQGHLPILVTRSHLIKVPPSPKYHDNMQALGMQTFQDTSEQSDINVYPQEMCDFVLYSLPTWKVSRQVEFLSNLEHSELRSAHLSPSTYLPLHWVCQFAISAMWSSAVTPLVGSD